MARVTVEDCILKIPNRFELVMLSARRARDISSGAALTVDRDNDKNPVVALREIAEDTISIDELSENMIQNLQKHTSTEEPEEEIAELGVNMDADLSVGSPMGEPDEPEEEEELAEDMLTVSEEAGAGEGEAPQS